MPGIVFDATLLTGPAIARSAATRGGATSVVRMFSLDLLIALRSDQIQTDALPRWVGQVRLVSRSSGLAICAVQYLRLITDDVTSW